MPNVTQWSLWPRNRMDSSVLPMMLCMRQLGWKRNFAKACPEKPFWVKKGQETSCKRYKMRNMTQKSLWPRNRIDSSVLWMMLCMRQLGWKRNLSKACPEKPFWVKKGQERSCQTSHNKGLWFRSMTTWQDGFQRVTHKALHAAIRMKEESRYGLPIKAFWVKQGQETSCKQ
jgi:hypothetical protein